MMQLSNAGKRFGYVSRQAFAKLMLTVADNVESTLVVL